MTLNLILISAAIALDPLPLGAYILILGSKNGIRKGLGFLIGWLLCLGVIIAATLLLTGGRPPKPNTAPSNALLVVQIVAGIALLYLAWHQRRKGARPPKPKPKWQTNLDRLNAFAAAGVAALLQPWVMAGAGAASVAQADLSKTSDLIGVIIYAVLATSTYLVMQTFAMLRPQATMERLQGLNQWINDHRDPALIILYTVLGLWLVGKATAALV